MTVTTGTPGTRSLRLREIREIALKFCQGEQIASRCHLFSQGGDS
jgi:hypothetical protein